jgi:hypothetical protein
VLGLTTVVVGAANEALRGGAAVAADGIVVGVLPLAAVGELPVEGMRERDWVGPMRLYVVVR